MHQAPSRGTLAGIKDDIQKAKDSGYTPNGIGNAYSHNFLNQVEFSAFVLELQDEVRHRAM